MNKKCPKCSHEFTISECFRFWEKQKRYLGSRDYKNEDVLYCPKCKSHLKRQISSSGMIAILLAVGLYFYALTYLDNYFSSFGHTVLSGGILVAITAFLAWRFLDLEILPEKLNPQPINKNLSMETNSAPPSKELVFPNIGNTFLIFYSKS